MAVLTLFGQPASPASLTSDSADYTMGVQFSVSVSGATLTAIWFYSAPGAGALPDSIALYAVTGASLVHSETASWSGAAGSGWVRAAFSSPPSLTSGTSYKACIFENTGNFFYSTTAHYWDTGAGSGGIVNGPLSAPNNAGADGGQDTFTNSSSLSYPSSSFNAANYWMDPEVTTPATNISASFGLAMAPLAESFTAAERISGHFGLAMAPLAESFTGHETGVNISASFGLAMAPLKLRFAQGGQHRPGTPDSDEARGFKRWLLWDL